MNFFRFPWAITGDRTAIPQTTQVDGSVSFQEGFGPDYAREQGVDPLAKDIPRNQFNEAMYAITENLRQWQTFGVFPFITAAQNGGVAFNYAKNAQTLWTDGEVYVSLIDNNTDPDPSISVNWKLRLANPTPTYAIMPVGFPGHVFDTVAPAGWVIRNGLTIGNTGSGATNRANSDTEQLFTRIWNMTPNIAPYIIQDSGGAPTVRGVSAAADFLAGKRMPTPNSFGRVDRGFNPGAGPVTAALGFNQEDAIQYHGHQQPRDNASGGGGNILGGGGAVGGVVTMNQAVVSAAGHDPVRLAEETLVKNTAFLPIISLGV